MWGQKKVNVSLTVLMKRFDNTIIFGFYLSLSLSCIWLQWFCATNVKSDLFALKLIIPLNL